MDVHINLLPAQSRHASQILRAQIQEPSEEEHSRGHKVLPARSPRRLLEEMRSQAMQTVNCPDNGVSCESCRTPGMSLIPHEMHTGLAHSSHSCAGIRCADWEHYPRANSFTTKIYSGEDIQTRDPSPKDNSSTTQALRGRHIVRSISPPERRKILPELCIEMRCSSGARPARMSVLAPKGTFREMEPGYGWSPCHSMQGWAKGSKQKGLFCDDSYKLLPKLQGDLTSLTDGWARCFG